MNILESSLISDAPLVSIIMLAYNQRDMIDDAITSLLSQDYSNLELIISDDCSSDNTFERMNEIASSYNGPHTIIVNKTPSNRGTLIHFYQAVARSRGRLIIAAGGDDISLPNRVSTLVAAWQKTNADALFSEYTVIDMHGNVIPGDGYLANAALKRYFCSANTLSIFGATAAYSRQVFNDIKAPDNPVYFEDMYMSLMIHYNRGKVVKLDEKLVLYRKHPMSLTNSHGSAISVKEAELKSQRTSRDLYGILSRFREMVERNAGNIERPTINVDAVRKVEEFYKYSSSWIDTSIYFRLKYVITARSIENLRWSLPRVLGISAFMIAKKVQNVAKLNPKSR